MASTETDTSGPPWRSGNCRKEAGVKVAVTKAFSFDAAHQLPWHEGKCRHLHGHTYRLEVTVAGAINENGIVLDFDELSATVKGAIVERFDHQFLNDHFPNPTAELLALEFAK